MQVWRWNLWRSGCVTSMMSNCLELRRNKYSGNNDMLSSLRYFWLYEPKVICHVEFGVTKGFAKTVTPSHPYC